MRVNSVVVELNNHFFVPILGGTGAVGVDEELTMKKLMKIVFVEHIELGISFGTLESNGM